MEAIAARIEPLEFRRKVEKKMRFDLGTHDRDALFSIIAKQQPDQAVSEANDAVRRETARRRDARSVAVAGTKPQGSVADGHDSRESAKAAGVEKSGTFGTTTMSALRVASKVTSSRTDAKASRVRQGKAPMARATTRPLYSSSSPQAVPLSIPGPRQPGCPLRLPPIELKHTRPPQRRWLRRPNLLRLNHLRRMTTTTCTFACRGKGWRQWIITDTVQHQVSQSAGPQNASPVFHSVLVQLPAPASQQSCDDSSTISYVRISVLQPGGSGDTRVHTVKTEPRFEALTQHVTGRLVVPGASATAEVKVLMDSGSGITDISE